MINVAESAETVIILNIYYNYTILCLLAFSNKKTRKTSKNILIHFAVNLKVKNRWIGGLYFPKCQIVKLYFWILRSVFIQIYERYISRILKRHQAVNFPLFEKWPKLCFYWFLARKDYSTVYSYILTTLKKTLLTLLVNKIYWKIFDCSNFWSLLNALNAYIG